MARKKKRLIEKIFKSISIIFIISGFIFYGFRLVKYYKIFNPKITEKNEGLISIAIPKKSSIVTSGNGLYHISGSYIYKGDIDDNYIMVSGMMFRILKINYGSSVEIILDEPINKLSWGNEYSSFDKSELYKYLNTYFLNYVDKSLLTETNFCLDSVVNIENNKSECKKNYKAYVKTLDINTYLNTISNSSYLNEELENIWLMNTNENSIWYINGSNIASASANNYYNVLPVLTLNMDTLLIGGTGTKNDPYRVDATPDYAIGSYVKLANDNWRIIAKKNDELTLSYDDVLGKLMPFGTNSKFDKAIEGSLAYYLNNDFYNNLSYKDLIIESDYYSGKYAGIETASKETTKAYVSIPSMLDPKYNGSDAQYYLLNGFDEENIFVYGNEITTSTTSLSKSIKPVIKIKKDSLNKGDGTKNSPYTREA